MPPRTPRCSSAAHKGFTAPSNAPGVKEETALNYEAGARIYGQHWNGELTAFLSDYDNLLGECTASSGADCEIGDAFNGDAATVRGIEASFSTDLSTAPGFQLPLTLTFTHMDARFDSDVADTDFFGDVRRGDPLPYLPKRQMHAVLGVLRGPAEANIALQYVDEVCVRASCGDLEKTDSALTVDAAASMAAEHARHAVHPNRKPDPLDGDSRPPPVRCSTEQGSCRGGRRAREVLGRPGAWVKHVARLRLRRVSWR